MGEGRVITRVRPSLTCVPCKRKKVKCDKQKPVCSQCTRSSATCFYETIAAPDGSWEQNHRLKRQKNGLNHTRAIQVGEGTQQQQQQRQSQIHQHQHQQHQQQQQQHREDGISSSSSPGRHAGPGQASTGIQQTVSGQTTPNGDMMQWTPDRTQWVSYLTGDMEPEITSFFDGSGNMFTAANLRDMENFYHDSVPPSDFMRGPSEPAAGEGVGVLAVPTTPTPTLYDATQFASPLLELPAASERINYADSNTSASDDMSGTTLLDNSRPAPTSTPQHREEGDLSAHLTKTATMEALDFDEKTAKPRRYIPDEQDGPSVALPGNLNNAPGNLVRFMGSPFWAWAGSNNLKSSVGNVLLTSHLSQYQSSQMHLSRQAELSRMMQTLPSKKLCDILLDSFLLGVWPILPLLDVTSLRDRYDAFWARFSRSGSASPQRLPADMGSREDLGSTFPSLLWAVLYSGAVAVSPAVLARAAFRINDRPAFLSRLRTKVNQSLHLCCQSKIPTLDGLVASLLAQWCDPSVDQIIDMPPFISQSIQAARTLGLHKETALAMRAESEAEVGRQVWYHLMELETIATIRSGTCLSHSASDGSYDTRPPKGLSLAGTDDASVWSSSVAVLSAARIEMARVLRQIIKTCYTSTPDFPPPSKENLKQIAAEIEKFENTIDELASNLTVRGLPEHGQISSMLLGANTLLHRELYVDNPRESNVPNAFFRISLSMIKFNVTILFNRQFLQSLPRDQTARIWNLQISNCVQLIRNYLDLCRLPAFAPYRWLFPGKVDVFQECMTVLTFLKEHPGSPEGPLLHYLLSEVFNMLEARGKGEDGTFYHAAYPQVPSTQCGSMASWRVLKQLYNEIFEGGDDDNNDEERAEDSEDDNDADDSDNSAGLNQQHRQPQPHMLRQARESSGARMDSIFAQQPRTEADSHRPREISRISVTSMDHQPLANYQFHETNPASGTGSARGEGNASLGRDGENHRAWSSSSARHQYFDYSYGQDQNAGHHTLSGRMHHQQQQQQQQSRSASGFRAGDVGAQGYTNNNNNNNNNTTAVLNFVASSSMRPKSGSSKDSGSSSSKRRPADEMPAEWMDMLV